MDSSDHPPVAAPRDLAGRLLGRSFAASGADRLIGLWLATSLALLFCGLFLPAITVRQLVFSKEYSLFEGVIAFLEAGDYFLFAVTFGFSMAVPTVKIAAGLYVWLAGANAGVMARRALRVLAVTSRWSMLDVFIIALAVLVIDGQLLSSADIHYGLIAFTAAVLLSTYAVKRTNSLTSATMAAHPATTQTSATD